MQSWQNFEDRINAFGRLLSGPETIDEIQYPIDPTDPTKTEVMPYEGSDQHHVGTYIRSKLEGNIAAKPPFDVVMQEINGKNRLVILLSRAEVRTAQPETFDKFINNPWLSQFYFPPENRKELKQTTEAAFTLDHPLKKKAIEKILALPEEDVLREAYWAVDQERRRRFHSGLNRKMSFKEMFLLDLTAPYGNTRLVQILADNLVLVFPESLERFIQGEGEEKVGQYLERLYLVYRAVEILSRQPDLVLIENQDIELLFNSINHNFAYKDEGGISRNGYLLLERLLALSRLLIPIDNPQKQISAQNLLALIEKLEASHPSWKRILELARSIRPEEYKRYSAAGQILVWPKILELKEALASFRTGGEPIQVNVLGRVLENRRDKIRAKIIELEQSIAQMKSEGKPERFQSTIQNLERRIQKLKTRLDEISGRAEMRENNDHIYETLLEGIGEQTPDWQRMNVIASVILHKIREQSRPFVLDDQSKTRIQKKMTDQRIGEHADVPGLIRRMKAIGFIREIQGAFELAVEPQVFAIKFNNIRFIKKEFETHITDWKDKAPAAGIHLARFVGEYAEAVDRWKRYPIESRYPVLKAITLMNVENRKLLLKFVKEQKPILGNRPLIDSIILMLSSKIPEKWLQENAPKMVGRKVLNIGPEAVNAAGGLGRVQQSHGAAFQVLADEDGQLGFVEPYYLFRIKKIKEIIRDGETEREIERDILVRDVDYSKLPLPVEGLDLYEIQEGNEKKIYIRNPAFTYTVKVRKGRERKDVTVEVFKGKIRIEKDGKRLWIDVYLIQDKPGTEDGNVYYTKALYRYGYEYGSATSKEFTEFFSKAALKLQKRLKKIEREGKQAKGEVYKPHVFWLQDGQSGPLGVFKRMSDELDSLTPEQRETLMQEDPYWREHIDLITDPETEDSLMDVEGIATTHTIPNRGEYDHEEGEDFMHGMRIPKKYRQYFNRGGSHYDSTSGMMRTLPGNGVSAMQVQTIVSKADPKNNSIAITNGDNLLASSEFFRNIFMDKSFQQEFPGADPENPTPEQLVKEKLRAKWLLKQDKKMLELDEEFANLNPFAPVFGYYGRLVPEKAGFARAFVEENLELLLKRGANVIIFGNVQGSDVSKAMFEYIKDVQKRLNGKGYKGRLIVASGWGLPEQRLALSATDVQVNDSDSLTEAAGFSETNVAVNGGLEITFREGIYEHQGEVLDWSEAGVGNVLLVGSVTPEGYRKVYDKVLDEYGFDPEHPDRVDMTKRLNFATYQVTSVRLSQVLKAELTSAEYYRFLNQTVEMAENPVKILVNYAIGNISTSRFFKSEWLRKSLSEAIKKLDLAVPFQVNARKANQDADVFIVPGISDSGQVNIVAVERGTRYDQFKAEFTIRGFSEKIAKLFGLESLDQTTDRFAIIDAVSGERYGSYSGKELIENGLFIGIPPDTHLRVLKMVRIPADHSQSDVEANKSTIFFSPTAPPAVKDAILSLFPKELLNSNGNKAEDLVWFTPWEGFSSSQRRPPYLNVYKGSGHLRLSHTTHLEGFFDPLRQLHDALAHKASAYIDLRADEDVLWIGYGTMESFPEARVKPYSDFNRPVFHYWYQNHLLPFAISLGFRSIKIRQFDLTDGQLKALGFKKVSTLVDGEPAVWEAPVVQRRSELREKPAVGIIGLDRLGYEWADYYQRLGAKVSVNGVKSGSFLRYVYDYFFSSRQSLKKVIKESDIIYVNVTPREEEEPEAFRHRLYGIVSDAARALSSLRRRGHDRYKTFVIRSVVPFDFGEGPTSETSRLEHLISQQVAGNFEIIYQPVFLRRDPTPHEIESERIILGTLNGNKTRGTDQIASLLQNKASEIEITTARSAELVHNLTGFYLAKKTPHFSQFTELLEEVDGDISEVALMAGSDKRISLSHTKVGLPFGGWLETVTKSMLRALEKKRRPGEAEQFEKPEFGKLWQMLNEIATINQNQLRIFKRLAEKYLKEFPSGNLSGKTIALLGVANRPESKRVQGSPALTLVEWLVLNKGVKKILIFDPYAKDEFNDWLSKKKNKEAHFKTVTVEFVSYEKALKQSDVAIVGMAHPEIMRLSPQEMAKHLAPPENQKKLYKNGSKPLFDGWNIYGIQPDGSFVHTLEAVHETGLNYISMGRKPIGPVFGTTAVFDTRVITRSEEIQVLEQLRKDVAMIGTGYVGLVTGAEFAVLGHSVIAVDKLEAKINKLNRDERVIYEPGLDELLKEHREEKNITFTTDLKYAVRNSKFIFVAVGTPSAADGTINLEYIEGAARDIGEVIAKIKEENHGAVPAPREQKIIVIKSTVTPDAFPRISEMMKTKFGLDLGIDYALASTPEHLQEGIALAGVQKPDRIVIGVDKRMNAVAINETAQSLLELFRPRIVLMEQTRIKIEGARKRGEYIPASQDVPQPRIIVGSTGSATVEKYLANTYLASDIVFSDLSARIAKSLGAAWSEISVMLQRDPRISPFWFRRPGCGYGGSCSPKDVKAILRFMEQLGLPATFLHLITEFNDWVKQEAFVSQIVEVVSGKHWHPQTQRHPAFGFSYQPLQGYQLGIWGLAFKADTDDVREAPSLDIIPHLIKLGAKVVAHDPLEEARANFMNELSNQLGAEALEKLMKEGKFKIVSNAYDAARDSHAIVLLTEWKNYLPGSEPERIDFGQIKQLMRTPRAPVLIAGRSLYSPQQMASLGFKYSSVDNLDVDVSRETVVGEIAFPEGGRSEMRISAISKSKVSNRIESKKHRVIEKLETIEEKLTESSAPLITQKRRVVISYDALISNKDLQQELIDVLNHEVDRSLQIAILAPDENALIAERRIITELKQIIFLHPSVQLETPERMIRHTVDRIGSVRRQLTYENAYSILIPKMRHAVGVYDSDDFTPSVVVIDNPKELNDVRSKVARVVAAPLAIKTALLISQMGDRASNINLRGLIVPSEIFATLEQLVSAAEAIKLAA